MPPRPRGWAGWRATFVAGLLASASMMILAGCETVVSAGSTGISVDSQARPVIVFAVCHDHIDAAMIYRDRTKTDPKDVHPSVSTGSWDAVSPVTPTTAVQSALNTAQPSESWSQRRPSEALRPGVVYTAFGGTRDNTWYTGSVDFTLERLAKLTPGRVLTQTYVPETDRYVDTVRSYEQFRAESCTGRS